MKKRIFAILSLMLVFMLCFSMISCNSGTDYDAEAANGGAGGEELAREVATELIDGLSTAASVPAPRFSGDGQYKRAACCMIYHSPNADMCTSCPHLR